MTPPELLLDEDSNESPELPSVMVERGETPRPRRFPYLPLLALASVAGAGLFFSGQLQRRADAAPIAQGAPKARPAALPTLRPKKLARTRTLALPASLAASEETVVHARASGFLRRWLVDIGDRVEARQLLAEIETPELDRELEQARARVAQREAAVTLARASRDFSRSSLARFSTLEQRKLTSAQDLDERKASLAVEEAKVLVAEAERAQEVANLRRLEQLRAFAEVRAPFAGTITARHAERGALITAGAAAPLFELAALDVLRVTIDVPQSLAHGVERGQAADLTVPEYPAEHFAAKVTRASGRLDVKSRTLRVELEIPNGERLLMPGMYGRVEVTLESARDVYVLPATAVWMSKDGAKVGVVQRDGRVRLQTVAVERDNGSELEIASGLRGDETLLTNPMLAIEDGIIDNQRS